MSADFRAIRRNWEYLQGLRSIRDSEMQQIADVFMPRKSFICTPEPGVLRPRRINSSVPQKLLNRSAAMLVGYLFDPTRPNVMPNAREGLRQAGRAAELEPDSADYLTNTAWNVHDHMMRPKAKFFGALSRVALEMVGFGTGVFWVGRKRGFGANYMARPFRSCWIAENDDGVVDTLYFRWTMPAWKVLDKYPEAAKIDKLAKLATDEKTQQSSVTLLHVVEPRRNPIMGGVATNMPFASVVLAPDFDGAILEETGYVEFPYGVPRLGVEEGSAYGTGLAWQALPTALVHNDLQGSVERGVAGRVEPPMFAPSRFLSKPLDRRRGAVNYYDEAGLGFQSLKDAIQYLPPGGDVGIGTDWLRMLAADMEEVFLTDWMKLRENGDVTAEEIIERRELRVRAMTAYVPNVDRDLMGVAADRTLTIMDQEDLLEPPPEQLSGVNVEWEYAGPLAIAQQRGQVDSFRQLLTLAQQAVGIDPASTAVLSIEEGLRAAAEALAAPAGMIRSRVEVARMREEAAQAARDQHEAEMAAQAGAAFRDAGQGVNSLVAADAAQRGQQLAA